MTRLAALLFFIVAVGMVPRECLALIGETQAQIKARMGSPVDVVENQSIYQRGGFTVVVTYWNGVSVFENISRAFVNLKLEHYPESDIMARHIAAGDKLSDNELQTLLGVYGAGLPWEPAAGGWFWNELQAFLDVYWAGLPATGHRQRGFAPVAREDHAWRRSDGKVAATYQDEQPPVRLHMNPLEEEAIRKTPSLLVFNVAFALALKREQAAQSSEEAAQKKQAETNQITSVFGPMPATPAETIQMRMSGAINNRGRSAVGAMNTPMGRYNKLVSDAIGKRWDFNVQQRADLISVGSVKIHFAITPSGKVEDVRILAGKPDTVLADISLDAIIEAEIPPIPPDVAATLDGNRLEADYDFSEY